jgi:hypothetical protein
MPDFSSQTATRQGTVVAPASADSGGFSHYAVVYEGLIDIPRDGGYTFHLSARDGARLTLDGQSLVSTGTPFAEVCGSPVNAVRYAEGTIGLRSGKHQFRMETLESMSPFNPNLLWEGPGIQLSKVPEKAFSHLNSGEHNPARPALQAQAIDADALRSR